VRAGVAREECSATRILRLFVTSSRCLVSKKKKQCRYQLLKVCGSVYVQVVYTVRRRMLATTVHAHEWLICFPMRRRRPFFVAPPAEETDASTCTRRHQAFVLTPVRDRRYRVYIIMRRHQAFVLAPAVS
jgi:hypothetical protein